MMGLDSCLLTPSDPLPSTSSTWQQHCAEPNGSASHLIESTLGNLKSATPMRQDWQLGYTLKVPLLSLLKRDGPGWQVDKQAIDRIMRTIRDNPRALVLYLFSTHFSDNAPIEAELVKDPDNVAYTSIGPLSQDTYYGQPIYPWSVARTDNAITRYRSQVVDALLNRLCSLPSQTRHRIQGITLLGEVHHLFPDFSAGMGFDTPYRVTDYSTTSVTAFRQYLVNRYTHIDTLNRQLGSKYTSFESVNPPSKDIRTETLERFEEHFDAFATGTIPVSGWVHAAETSTTSQWVNIYLDGRLIAKTPVHLSRQDVGNAHPEYKTADLGWRYNIDFSQMPVGIHRIDVALSLPGQEPMHVGMRTISIMDRQQTTPVVQPMIQLPHMQTLPPRISAFLDQPKNQFSYYFNPMAREWQAFRESQVTQYLQYFDGLVAQTCFADTPRYTHQIVPQFNPSWDSQRYAVADSLKNRRTPRTGISLYGEASYGRSVTDWLTLRPHEPYGVTEFHPLRAMDPVELGSVLQRHHDQGARFLSFFMDTQWQGQRINPSSNFFIFTLDQDNQKFGSDQLFSSIKSLLHSR